MYIVQKYILHRLAPRAACRTTRPRPQQDGPTAPLCLCDAESPQPAQAHMESKANAAMPGAPALSDFRTRSFSTLARRATEAASLW